VGRHRRRRLDDGEVSRMVGDTQAVGVGWRRSGGSGDDRGQQGDVVDGRGQWEGRGDGQGRQGRRRGLRG
jgi:hypothetical protein